MPRTCSVPGCKSNYQSTLNAGGSLISAFKFPSDIDLRNKWLNAISRKNWTPTKYSVVCCLHFPENDIIRFTTYTLSDGTLKTFPNRPKLPENSIPSIFLSPSHVPPNKRRKTKLNSEVEDKKHVEIETDRYQEEYYAKDCVDKVQAGIDNNNGSGESDLGVSMEHYPTDSEQEDEMDLKLEIEEHVKIELDTYIKEFKKDPFIEPDKNSSESRSSTDHEIQSVSVKSSQTDVENRDKLGCKLEIKIEKDSYEEAYKETHHETIPVPVELTPTDLGNMSNVYIKEEIGDKVKVEIDSYQEGSGEKFEELDENEENFVIDRNKENQNTPQQEKNEIEQKKHEKLQKFACSICQKQYSKQSALKSHMFTHLNEDQNMLELDFVDICENLGVKCRVFAQIGDKEYDWQAFKCRRCDYVTLWSSQFDRHIKGNHLHKKYFKCEFCTYSSSRKFDLEMHIERHHTFSKDSEYNPEFSDKVEVKPHTVISRNENKRFTCETCQYSTNYSSNLKVHRRKHMKGQMKDSMFMCSVCQKKSNWADQLKRHMFTHLKVAQNIREWNAVEICEELGVKCRIEAEIGGDEYDWKAFKCRQCDYMSLWSSAFDRHLKEKHLNKFNFKCELCTFRSSTKRDLEMHMNSIHLKINKFECDYCQYFAYLRKTLYAHIRQKHPTEETR